MPLTLDASWVSGRIVTDVFSLPEGRQSGAVRWIGATPPGRLLAAIAPRVYRRLASGQVPVTTTLGGEVRVVVRSARRVVADRRVTIGPGDSEVSLQRRLPQGNYRVTLTVRNGPQSPHTA
jgi:hypothetical protein